MSLAVSGWIALACVPVTALTAWLLRRFLRGAILRRMRLHFVFGYAALVFALVHLSLSMGSMRGADSTGLWLATLAMLALGLQVLLGTNLQSAGAGRAPLRRLHLLLFVTIVALAIGHVALNSRIFSQFASRIGDVAVVEHPIGLPTRILQQRLQVFEKTPLAAHAVDGVRGGKIRARTTPTSVAEEP